MSGPGGPATETDDEIRRELVRDLKTILNAVEGARIQREALEQLRARAREMAHQLRVT